MRGTKATTIAIGAVVMFLGLLVLLAVPAAEYMDLEARQEALAEGEALPEATRRDGIVVGGGAVFVLGAVLVVWGLVMKERS